MPTSRLSDAPPPISAAEMAQLRREFDARGIVEVIHMFREEGELILRNLAAALEKQDAHVVRRAAHAFRGASTNFGAATLEALCRELEVNARRGDLTDGPDLLDRIDSEYRRVDLALELECHAAHQP